MHWLDKYIDEQAEQKQTLDEIAQPYSPAELCEMIMETDE